MLTGCIGQLKWRHFAKAHRPLIHIESFENATWDPYSALNLAWRLKGVSLLTRLGAVLFFVAWSIEPFTQQTLSFPSLPTAGLGAEMAHATQVSSTGYQLVTFIHVEWIWFATPASVVLLTCVVLIILIISECRSGAPVWKRSSLALMFHGLSEHYAEQIDGCPEGIGQLSSMTGVARQLKVRLQRVPALDDDLKLIRSENACDEK